MAESRKYLAPSWDQTYSMLLDLALRIRKSGFKADLIVGVSRGGWVPARILSDLLENSCTANLRIEFYTGIGETAAQPRVTQPVSSEVTGKTVLLVDDVSDSGGSLKVAKDYLLAQKASGIKTVTLYYKPRSIFKPDFFNGTTEDWIIFPWEQLEVTKQLLAEAKQHGQNVNFVRAILERCKIANTTIDGLFRLANEV